MENRIVLFLNWNRQYKFLCNIRTKGL
jgi:hypothetical protein